MGVLMGVAEGVSSSESVERSAAFLLLPRLPAGALPFFAAILPFPVPSAEFFLELVFSFFPFSVVPLFVLLLVVSSVLAFPAALFLAPPLLLTAGSFLFDAALSFSVELLRDLVLPAVSLFALPFLLAPPLVVAVLVSSLPSGGWGSSRVSAGGSYNKIQFQYKCNNLYLHNCSYKATYYSSIILTSTSGDSSSSDTVAPPPEGGGVDKCRVAGAVGLADSK